VAVLLPPALLVILVVFVIWLAKRIAVRGLTAEQLKRRALVHKSVWMQEWQAPARSITLRQKPGWIVFAFERAPYGAEFAALNGGETL
jgi:hypothetical protein